MNPAIQTMRAAAFVGGLWLPLPAVATDPRPELMVCMTPREARAAVGSGRAVAFASVKREAETSSGGEVLRARLCQIDGRLSYVLTVLRHGGQVITVVVDAERGTHRQNRSSPWRGAQSFG